MKILLRILGGLAVLVLLLVVIAFFLPREFVVQRTIAIKAKPEVVHANVADLRAWRNWTAWHERDPQMTLSYSEKTTGVGAWSSWKSKTEGDGKMTLTKVDFPKGVEYDLVFEDVGMRSTGNVTILPDRDGVTVIWSSRGDLGMNPMNRWFGLFLDKMIGPDFEGGLRKLARISLNPPSQAAK